MFVLLFFLITSLIREILTTNSIGSIYIKQNEQLFIPFDSFVPQNTDIYLQESFTWINIQNSLAIESFGSFNSSIFSQQLLSTYDEIEKYWHFYVLDNQTQFFFLQKGSENFINETYYEIHNLTARLTEVYKQSKEGIIESSYMINCSSFLILPDHIIINCLDKRNTKSTSNVKSDQFIVYDKEMNFKYAYGNKTERSGDLGTLMTFLKDESNSIFFRFDKNHGYLEAFDCGSKQIFALLNLTSAQKIVNVLVGSQFLIIHTSPNVIQLYNFSSSDGFSVIATQYINDIQLIAIDNVIDNHLVLGFYFIDAFNIIYHVYWNINTKILQTIEYFKLPELTNATYVASTRNFYYIYTNTSILSIYKRKSNDLYNPKVDYIEPMVLLNTSTFTSQTIVAPLISVNPSLDYIFFLEYENFYLLSAHYGGIMINCFHMECIENATSGCNPAMTLNFTMQHQILNNASDYSVELYILRNDLFETCQNANQNLSTGLVINMLMNEPCRLQNIAFLGPYLNLELKPLNQDIENSFITKKYYFRKLELISKVFDNTQGNEIEIIETSGLNPYTIIPLPNKLKLSKNEKKEFILIGYNIWSLKLEVRNCHLMIENKNQSSNSINDYSLNCWLRNEIETKININVSSIVPAEDTVFIVFNTSKLSLSTILTIAIFLLFIYNFLQSAKFTFESPMLVPVTFQPNLMTSDCLSFTATTFDNNDVVIACVQNGNIILKFNKMLGSLNRNNIDSTDNTFSPVKISFAKELNKIAFVKSGKSIYVILLDTTNFISHHIYSEYYVADTTSVTKTNQMATDFDFSLISHDHLLIIGLNKTAMAFARIVAFDASYNFTIIQDIPANNFCESKNVYKGSNFTSSKLASFTLLCDLEIETYYINIINHGVNNPFAKISHGSSISYDWTIQTIEVYDEIEQLDLDYTCALKQSKDNSSDLTLNFWSILPDPYFEIILGSKTNLTRDSKDFTLTGSSLAKSNSTLNVLINMLNDFSLILRNEVEYIFYNEDYKIDLNQFKSSQADKIDFTFNPQYNKKIIFFFLLLSNALKTYSFIPF